MTGPDLERISTASRRAILGSEERGVVSVTDREHANREIWAAALVTVGLAAALVFGIIVLIGGDWIPGTIIVAATLIGLATQVGTIHRLHREASAPSPKRHKPTD
jgi:hypothetical protein